MAAKKEQRLLLVRIATKDGRVDDGELKPLLDDGWNIAQIQALTPFSGAQYHVVLLLEREAAR